MRKTGSVVGLVIGIALMVGAGLLWWNRVWILDTIAVSQYTPSAQIEALTVRTGLSSEGKRILYATHPAINQAKEFNAECGEHEKTAVVLGCFTGLRIHIFDVNDSELDGVMEVTVSHETLHAAYSRLSDAERSTVDALVEKEASRLAADPAFVERMKVYDDLDKRARLDELHAVIGTEVASIDPELERHYQHYFSDRSNTTKLYQKYSGVFIALQRESAELENTIVNQENSINQRVKTYNVEAKTLSDDIQDFNNRANGRYFTSQTQFDRERAGLLARSSALDSERASIEAATVLYKQNVERYNSISTHINKLNNSLDSTLTPAPEV